MAPLGSLSSMPGRSSIRLIVHQAAVLWIATSAAALATPRSTITDGSPADKGPRREASVDGMCRFDAGLVSWWAADSDGRDQKGGNDGTLNGVSIVEGILDGAFGFDGEDDFVEVPDDSSLQLEAGDFTIALWARLDGSHLLQYDLLEKMFSAGGSVASGFILHIHNDVPGRLGTLRLCLAHAALNGHRCYDATTNIVDGGFHHVAVVRTGLAVSIYVDGQDDGATLNHAVQSLPEPPVSLLIGKRRSDTSFMDGVLDDIRFFNRALSGDEIHQMFRCAPTQCVGSCDLDAVVTVSELIQGVNIAIGALAVSVCPAFDTNRDGSVAVNELVAGVSDLLFGCGVRPPTLPPTSVPTPTSVSATPIGTPSATGTPVNTNTPTPLPPTATRTSTPTRTATPLTSCPLRFDDDTAGGAFCGYVGTATSRTCGTVEGVVGGWVSDGLSVTALVLFPGDYALTLYGVRSSATRANINSSAPSPDDAPFFADGTMALPSARQFTVQVDPALFVCSPFTFRGTFDSLVDP